jgi:hypothetical protein
MYISYFWSGKFFLVGAYESGHNPQRCRQENNNRCRWRCHADRIAGTVDQAGGGIDHRASSRGTVCNDDYNNDSCTDNDDNHDNHDEGADVTLRRTGFR